MPLEQKFYSENAFPQTVYVGHPLLDEVARYNKANVDDDGRPVVALLPGSRKQELHRMLPLMIQLAGRHKEYRFIIAGMSLIGEDFYRLMIPQHVDNVEIIFDSTYDILSSSYAAIVCSGTATLETALFRVPQVVCYQCSRLSAFIARRLIASRIKYISLVNLIADRPVVSELIQDQYNACRLEEEFAKITHDDENRRNMMDEYDRVIRMLGGEGASQRTTEEIIGLSSGRH